MYTEVWFVLLLLGASSWVTPSIVWLVDTWCSHEHIGVLPCVVNTCGNHVFGLYFSKLRAHEMSKTPSYICRLFQGKTTKHKIGHKAKLNYDGVKGWKGLRDRFGPGTLALVIHHVKRFLRSWRFGRVYSYILCFVSQDCFVYDMFSGISCQQMQIYGKI